VPDVNDPAESNAFVATLHRIAIERVCPIIAVSRVAIALMRPGDRRLTDKIYTDENLLGTWSAIDALPMFT
jgi:hypothetical protein